MVTMVVNYDVVSKEYEKEAQELINLLKNSGSKYKDTPIEKMNWFYTFSYFKEKGKYTPEYYEELLHMPFDKRLEEELSKVRVCLSMSAGQFVIKDRVKGISESIKEATKYVTIQKMVFEQEKIQDKAVMDSIPLPKEDQKPMSLEDQLKHAIEVEDYIEAARIRDEIKKDKEE